LLFGDSITGNFTIDQLDVSPDMSSFVFSSNTAYNVDANMQVKLYPVIGLYVTSSTTQPFSFLAWMKYFSSSNFTRGNYSIQAIAFSTDNSKIIVGFGPYMMLATLDASTGEVIYSGTAPSFSMNPIPYQGVVHTQNPYSLKQMGSNALMASYSVDYKTQTLLSLPSVNKACGLVVRSQD